MDPIDLFGESAGRLLRRAGLFASALVMGGFVAEFTGELSHGFPSPGDMWDAFCDAFSWILGSLFSSIGPLVVGLLCVFVMSSWAGWWWWVATVVLVSANALGSNHASPTQWVVCLLLNGMVGTGVWFLKAWQTNRWARELVEVESENQFERLTREMEAEARNKEEQGHDPRL